MKMKIPQVFLGLIGTITLLSGTGYYYVFVLGAPQLNPPSKESPLEQTKNGFKFQLETFNSTAMGTARSYGVILPPNYYQNKIQRYPVIFLLHGGHDDARAYIDKYAIANVLESLYKNKKLPPSIIITPDGNDQRGSNPLYDPDYFDGS